MTTKSTVLFTLRVVLAICVASLVNSSLSGQSGPTLTAIFPDEGEPGEYVTLTGTNFGTTPGTVSIGSTSVQPISWSDRSITIMVPVVGDAIEDVAVTVSSATSNPFPFSIKRAPCPEGSSQISGTAEVSVLLRPCETLQVLVQGSGACGGFFVNMDGQNANGSTVFTGGEAMYCSGSFTAPANPPHLGTITTPPRAAVVRHWVYPGPGSSSITLIKTPRPFYNIAGVGFSSAPLITVGQELKGNIAGGEWDGHNYKLVLAPGQTVGLRGVVSSHPFYGSNFEARLFNESLSEVKFLAGFGSAGDNQAFPADLSAAPSYTNTSGQPMTLYLRLNSGPAAWDYKVRLYDKASCTSSACASDDEVRLVGGIDRVDC